VLPYLGAARHSFPRGDDELAQQTQPAANLKNAFKNPVAKLDLGAASHGFPRGEAASLYLPY